MENIQVRKDQIKKKIEENRGKLTLACTAVATLGATYFYGKSKGETNIVVNLVPDYLDSEEPLNVGSVSTKK